MQIAHVQVPWGRLKCVEMGETVTLAGVRCTFMDANHCPGAVMILFQIPGRRTVLHTGDCRRALGAFAVTQCDRMWYHWAGLVRWNCASRVALACKAVRHHR
jgi:hypothetical protein